MDKDRGYILHILEAIEHIESFTDGYTFDSMVSDTKTAKAVERSLEIIGEAAKNISEKFKSENRNIDWKDVVGTRDKIIHHYFDVDYNIVWDIIQNDLPKLKAALLKFK